jgi:hypothetical protein
VVHPFGPGVLSEIRVAATVPVVFAGPVADTHSPTFSAAAVAAVVAVTMVALVAVMVSVVVAWVVRLVVWMTIVAPDTETTFPVAKVPNWARVDPGVFPVGAPDGLADPAGRVPDPKPAVQEPLMAASTVILVAVNEVGCAAELDVALPAAAGWPMAVTQSPAVSVDGLTFFAWVKVVDAL